MSACRHEWVQSKLAGDEFCRRCFAVRVPLQPLVSCAACRTVMRVLLGGNLRRHHCVKRLTHYR